jgi:hypothetical protein
MKGQDSSAKASNDVIGQPRRGDFEFEQTLLHSFDGIVNCLRTDHSMEIITYGAGCSRLDHHGRRPWEPNEGL